MWYWLFLWAIDFIWMQFYEYYVTDSLEVKCAVTKSNTLKLIQD